MTACAPAVEVDVADADDVAEVRLLLLLLRVVDGVAVDVTSELVVAVVVPLSLLAMLLGAAVVAVGRIIESDGLAEVLLARLAVAE